MCKQGSLLLIFTVLLVGCGAKNSGPTPTANPAPPPPPSGYNWEFVFNNANSVSGTPPSSSTFTWGGQLNELSAPAITTKSLNGFYGSVGYGYSEFLDLTGTISGGAVNFTATSYQTWNGLIVTGTMAAGQEQMSGTWSLPGSFGSGTWTAQLLTPVTGTYSGTLVPAVSAPSPVTVTTQLVENTSQSSDLGVVTGTLSVQGTTCDGAAPTFTITKNSNINNGHQGEQLTLFSDPDANGVTAAISTVLNGVSSDGRTIDLVQQGDFSLQGGPCASADAYYTGTLTRQ